MKAVKHIFFLLLFVVVSFKTSTAQEIVFSATVDKKKVALNDYFELTYTIENADLKQFQPPDLSNFRLLGGPNQSTSMQIINGSMSRSVSLSYVLQPKTVGTVEIAPASFQYKGKVFKSNSVTVEAVQAGSSTTSPDQSQNETQQPGNEIADNVFIRAYVDKTNPYLGEQITVTFKLFTRLSIVNYGIDKMPALTGFWSNDIEFPQQLEVKKEVVDGVAYNVGTIRKVALFPQRDGTLEIDPLEMEAVVRIQQASRRRSFFDDFFGGYQDVKHTMKTNKININVKPLPRANRPTDFNGAVGDFSFDVSLNQTTTKVNEPLTYRIKISGQGNIKLIEEPKLDLPPDFEAYDPKVSETNPKGANPVKGSKTYEYLLIPRRPGEYRLPALNFSYFDPDKKDYVRLSSQEYLIKVEKGDGTYSSNTNQITGVSKENVELLGQDIRYIKTDQVNLKKQGRYFFGSSAFIILLISPLLLFAGALVVDRRRNKLQSNAFLLKRKKATGIARKRLKNAKKLMEQNNQKAFYNEVIKALLGYASDKFNIPTANLSKETVKEKLQGKAVREEDINHLMDTISKCEMALFAPSAVTGGMEQVYEDSTQLISTIESKA